MVEVMDFYLDNWDSIPADIDSKSEVQSDCQVMKMNYRVNDKQTAAVRVYERRVTRVIAYSS